MALNLRYATLCAILGLGACSSDGSGADAPRFQAGAGGAAPATNGPTPASPTPSQPPAADLPASTEVSPGDLPFQPSSTEPASNAGSPPPTATAPVAPPSVEPPPAEQPPAEQPPAEQEPPAEQPPVISTDVSTLPLPPGNGGQPEPSGLPGGLKVIDWAGFRSAVSYTFDDTNQTQIDHFDELMNLGVKFTWYFITGGGSGTRLQNPVWDRAFAAGHEVANHTRSHLNTGSPNLAQDTDDGEADVERRFNTTVFTMAAPFGAADYVNIASSRYLINRGVNGGQIAPDDATNPFSIPTFIPNQGAAASAFDNLVDQGRNNGTWHTVLVHGFLPQINGEFQPVDIGQFVQAVNYAKGFGDVWIDTVVEVGAYWIAQRVFDRVTPTTNGDTTTWAWTLPDHFPPNKFLRVTADGGTLTQDGAQLPWNDHGFYEVALDKGSLTLSP
jgi:peptidoglycan/xylan/chitin deacetylase (PgdA/CDA1 family)